MSTIDLNNNHSIVDYVAGVTKPLVGQRLSVMFWKTQNGIKRDSKCVSIPRINTADVRNHIESLLPHMVSMLEGVQNKLIREAYESRNVSTVVGSEIDINCCLAYLADSGSDGERLTKEVLSAWFLETVSDKLMLAIANKLGYEENNISEAEGNKIEAILRAYEDKVSKLASGAYKLPAKEAIAVKNAINVIGELDSIGSKLVSKLDKMINASEELLFAL